MNIKFRYTLAILFFACILRDDGLAQNGTPGGNLLAQSSREEWLGVKNYLILTPDLAGASRWEDQVAIPFSVRNNFDKDIELEVPGHEMEGLFVVDQAGEMRGIENFRKSGKLPPNITLWNSNVMTPSPQIVLKPGKSHSLGSPWNSMDALNYVTGMKIFGMIRGRIAGTSQTFMSYSAPFLVPPALTTPPFNDLGEQSYLSITPDLTKVGFSGGNFKITTLELQRADPNYADSIKNGWAEDVSIPFTIKNTSNQELVVAIDGIGCYILGNETTRNSVKKGGGWYLLKISTPILKPGESVSGESQWPLSWLENEGYKPGNQTIAVVFGRVANSNNIFECHSAPFELPPLPKGEPPTPASK